jgi:putative hemolysin
MGMTMRRTLAAIAGATCAALTVTLVSTGTAMAGEFAVAACQSDKLNNATAAFKDFATRGMVIKRACSPQGPGERGLITANIQRAGVVNRGAVSVATITAPPGTVIRFVRWRGQMDHDDCRFRVDLYAELQGNRYQDLKHKHPSASELATDRCRPRFRPAVFEPANSTGTKDYTVGNFNTVGARRIVQRVVCQARKFCSTGGKNFVQTLEVDMLISDVQAPTVTISPGTPLAGGAWVSGDQPLRYDAQDNVGVLKASAITSKGDAGSDARPCALASAGAFALPAPCPNGAGQITLNTREPDEGTQQIVVQARDAAGNPGNSAPVTARIDRTPPPQVPVSVDAGEQWRNRNDFALSWTNPAEDDRAPIVAATYKLCAAAGGNCTQAERADASIAALPVQVPGPGEWLASVWRRDEAGNQDAKAASVPVTLRYDPDPPQLGFEPSPAADPTAVAVQVTDGLSGLADGSIEIARAGSSTWQALATQTLGSRLLARIDDAALPAGDYVLRSTARDRAGNEASTTARLDGEQMAPT